MLALIVFIVYIRAVLLFWFVANAMRQHQRIRLFMPLWFLAAVSAFIANYYFNEQQSTAFQSIIGMFVFIALVAIVFTIVRVTTRNN